MAKPCRIGHMSIFFSHIMKVYENIFPMLLLYVNRTFASDDTVIYT